MERPGDAGSSPPKRQTYCTAQRGATNMWGLENLGYERKKRLPGKPGLLGSIAISNEDSVPKSRDAVQTEQTMVLTGVSGEHKEGSNGSLWCALL